MMEHGHLRLLASSGELRSKLRCLALLAIASSVLFFLMQYNLVEMMCLAEVDLDALAEAAREAASRKLPSGMTAS